MATTWILAAFDNSGLTVTINVYDLSDDTLIVTSGSMSEISTTGTYKYSFSEQDMIKDYFFQAIGSDGSVLSGIVDPNNDIKKALWNKKTLIGSSNEFQENLYDDDETTIIRKHNIIKSGNTQLRQSEDISTHRVYWGKNINTTLDENAIESLTNNSLEHDKVRQYPFSSGDAEYFWICWKRIFGKHSITKFLDNSDSSSIVFELPLEILVTDGTGNEDIYYAYRSTNTETLAKDININNSELTI